MASVFEGLWRRWPRCASFSSVAGMEHELAPSPITSRISIRDHVNGELERIRQAPSSPPSMSDEDWDYASFYTGRSNMELELPLPDFLWHTAAWAVDGEAELPHVGVEDHSAPAIQRKSMVSGAYSKMKQFGSGREKKLRGSSSVPDLKLKQILKPRPSIESIMPRRPAPITTYTGPPLPTGRDFAVMNRPLPATPNSDTDSVRAQDFPTPPPMNPVLTKALTGSFRRSPSESMSRRSGWSPRSRAGGSHPVILENVQDAARRRPHSISATKAIYATGPPSPDIFYTPFDSSHRPNIVVGSLRGPPIHSPTTSTSTAASSTLLDHLSSPTVDDLHLRSSTTIDNKYRVSPPNHIKIQSPGMSSFMDMEPENKKMGPAKKIRRALLRFARKVKSGGRPSDSSD